MPSCTRFAKPASRPRGVTAMYDGVIVGDYAVDLLVQGLVIVELKAIKAVAGNPSHPTHQLLRATGLQVCLLFNVGNLRLDLKRVVLCL